MPAVQIGDLKIQWKNWLVPSYPEYHRQLAKLWHKLSFGQKVQVRTKLKLKDKFIAWADMLLDEPETVVNCILEIIGDE